MKIKFICLILVLSLVASVCFADDILPADSEPMFVSDEIVPSDAAGVSSDGIKSDGVNLDVVLSDGKSPETDVNVTNDEKRR